MKHEPMETSTLEHRALLERVVRLKRRVTGCAPARAWSRDEAEELEQVVATLREHFAREESPGGMYAQLGEVPETDRLRDEHRLLLSWGRDLCVRSRDPTADGQALARSTDEFLTALAEHESREEELLREALR